MATNIFLAEESLFNNIRFIRMPKVPYFASLLMKHNFYVSHETLNDGIFLRSRGANHYPRVLFGRKHVSFV